MMESRQERLELHPIFDRFALYNDHYDGELDPLGDALGRDCMIAAFASEAPAFMRLFTGDGSKNEDWFSYGAKVFAPASGKIVYLYINKETNIPGTQNPSRASALLIETPDGTSILLGHIDNPVVALGDKVEEGQLLAYVGNNGYARCPHIHIGAYRKGKPLAIDFDAQKVAKVRRQVGERYWITGVQEPQKE